MRFAVEFIHDVAPGAADERILLLMLPGAKNTPQQLADYGFIRELRERHLPVDVLALHAHVDLYLDRVEVEALLREAFGQIRVHGYRRIWLLGISLGGSGAMICATQRMADIEGIFLLAPFLGTRGLIAEVEAAGGLRRWQAGAIEARDQERALLQRIRQDALQAGSLPELHLGYGREDRYRAASMLLAEHLHPQRVAVVPGGHDWETWAILWRRMLDRQPFAVGGAAEK